MDEDREPYVVRDHALEPAVAKQRFQDRMRNVFDEFLQIPPVELANATRQVLDEIVISPRRGGNSTARALVRGHAARELLKEEEGGHISADEARALLNLSKPSLLDRFHKGRIVGFRERNAIRFPVWQFSPDGGLLPGMDKVLARLAEKDSYDSWAKVLFFLNPRHSLGGRRPLDLLRGGQIKDVIELAEIDD
jgi:hypothetical protein